MFEDGSQRAGDDGVGIVEEIYDKMGGSRAKSSKKSHFFF
jgi:hypothetical protein